MRKKNLTFILCILLIAAGGFLLFFPGIATQGAYCGIITSLEILIPSLFPFMVLTLFLTESGLYEKILVFPAALISKITGIHKKYCCFFLLGMIGGYPSAAKNLSVLCKKKELNSQTAERLLCFCTNAGPSFLISAVGSKMFLSDSIGAILFISSVMSSFSLMFIYGKKLKSNHAAVAISNPPSLSISLINAVKGSCNALTMISSFVILFSVLIALIPNFTQNSSILKATILGFFEVTAGSACAAADISLFNVLITSALCGFGGLCVIFQISAICADAKISIRSFIISRILNAALNVIYTFLLLLAFPISTTQTYISNTASATPSIFSAPIPAFMLLLCCVAFPICLIKRKKL